MKTFGFPHHLITLIENLYKGRKSSIRTEHGWTDWFKNGKGVRQGCISLALPFQLIQIMRTAAVDDDGIKIGGRCISNPGYADDTVLLTNSEQDMQSLLHKVIKTSENHSLHLNIKKTKNKNNDHWKRKKHCQHHSQWRTSETSPTVQVPRIHYE